MGGKRSRYSSQGGSIRKKSKKSSAKKQTLSKVAERKAIAQAKLQNRLESTAAGTLKRSKNEVAGLDTGLSDLGMQMVENPESKAKEKYMKRCMGAYEELINGLVERKSGDMVKGGEKETGKDGVGKEALKEIVEEREEENVQKSLELENAAAANREKAHFNSGVVIDGSNRTGKMKAIGSFEGMGRVFVDLTAERRERLERDLKAGGNGVSVRSLGLQPSLYAKFAKLTNASKERGAGKSLEEIGKLEKGFISAMREYYDVFISHKVNVGQEDNLRQIYVAHCLSHVVRCRNRVIRNDTSLRGKDNVEELDKTRDQGFSRGRVLIIVGMKNAAYEIVKLLIAMTIGDEDDKKEGLQVGNKDRFEREFGPDPCEEKEDLEFENSASGGGGGGVRGKERRKPADHRHTFRGNIEDDLKLGICLTSKSVKLYSDFYTSDIIIASPLGLRRGLAEKMRGTGTHARAMKSAKQEVEEWGGGIGAADVKKGKVELNDDGFLSSIEVCVIDGAHILSMQNWDSLVKSVGMVNKMPKSSRETDFSRVRNWCLDGEMRGFRQTIVISEYRKLEFMALMRGFENHGGRVDMIEGGKEGGFMSDVVVNIRQTFFKVNNVESVQNAPDRRFELFFGKVMPLLRKLGGLKCLVVVPCYFDFVRVRNEFLRLCDGDATLRFASMCEYSKGADISRVRGRLYDGKVEFVVITERFHFFWRHWLRGANCVVWYQMAENGRFYAEMLNMLAEMGERGHKLNSVALFDRLDGFRMEMVVGPKRWKIMAKEGSANRFLFA